MTIVTPRSQPFFGKTVRQRRLSGQPPAPGDGCPSSGDPSMTLPSLALLLALAAPAAAPTGEELAAAARQVLKKHCSACHVGPGSENGYQFDALDRDSMTKQADGEDPVLVPKSLSSRIYVRAAVKKTMPPRSVKERPTADEPDTLKRWIEAGAPAAAVGRKVTFRPPLAELKAIHDDLAHAEHDARPFLRYITLTNLSNN